MLGKRRPGDFARNRTLLGVLVVGLIVVIGPGEHASESHHTPRGGAMPTQRLITRCGSIGRAR